MHRVIAKAQELQHHIPFIQGLEKNIKKMGEIKNKI